MKRIGCLFYMVLSVCTAMIGHTIHGSLFWALMDLIFMPFAWCKWLICRKRLTDHPIGAGRHIR